MIWLVLRYASSLPGLLVDDRGPSALKNGLEASFIALKLLTVVRLLFMDRSQVSDSVRTLIWSLCLLMLGGIMFMLYKDVHDSYNFLGHVFKLAGYYGFLKSIYVATVQQPFLLQYETKQQLIQIAYYDDLTGLPNRRSIMEALHEKIGTASSPGFGFMLLDLDRFKHINDTMGHSFGDALLTETAVRLRRFCEGKAMIARMGGDEFAVIWPDVQDSSAMESDAYTLLKTLAAPCRVGDKEYRLSCSIGIAIYPADGETPEVLMKHAEIAMYRSKEIRSRVESYTSDMSPNQERITLEHELRKAIENGEFVLYYQPRIQLDSSLMNGAEVLIRWNHPQRGRIAPSEFIPIAEETGLIVPIGEWVLREACLQWSEWRKAGLCPPALAVNLSSRQFDQAGFIDTIFQVLQETAMPPQSLELEITESIAMNIGHASEKLNALKRLGVQIAIDDFGTGYSSLSYLKRLPIDRLKIDRSFVQDLENESDDVAIVASITAMARHMNIRVVAEGVETEKQLHYLESQMCDEAQGYWFSVPLNERQFADYLLHNRQIDYVR